MKRPGIILDEDGDVREWALVLGYMLSIFIFTGLILLAYVAGSGNAHEDDMNKRANLKAFCDSIGGSLGDENCYKDSKRVTEEEYVSE